MKVSLKWLQTYFDAALPSAEKVCDALTFHAFEIEEASDDMLDVKVLPNRAADCLSHRGIAKELSAILDVPLKDDPLRAPLPVLPPTSELTVRIEDPKKCLRYMGALVSGVKVGPSPAWLREALEAVGARSINNVVDATNYVMLDIGQPLHAFDAAKLAQKDGAYAISVRTAKKGETMTTLSGEACVFTSETLVIADANTDVAVGIAGVKGGKMAEVTSATTDLVIESANFDGTVTRRSAQALRLFTDASQRFQTRPSPKLVAYGMRDVLARIQDIAGGKVAGVVDVYPAKPETKSVSVTLSHINGLLGSRFSADEALDIFKRLGLSARADGDGFTVTPSFERTDIVIPEDLVEEVGRILGYDRIPTTELPPISGTPDQSCYRGIELVKDFLAERGFSEISTQSFARKGEIQLANPLDVSKPALRASLRENMKEALTRATHVAPLILTSNEEPKLFEIGTVFRKNGEKIEIETSETVADLPQIASDASYEPKQYRLGVFKPFSVYPFIVRDVAFWAPSETSPADIEKILRENAGTFLVRTDQFDRFEKDGRVSYAFRLVFQSRGRTLTDEEIHGVMDGVGKALARAGFEVR